MMDTGFFVGQAFDADVDPFIPLPVLETDLPEVHAGLLHCRAVQGRAQGKPEVTIDHLQDVTLDPTVEACQIARDVTENMQNFPALPHDEPGRHVP